MQNLLDKLQKRTGQLIQLEEKTTPQWGLMTPQHMIEHIGMIVYGTAHGKGQSLVIPEEEATKWKSRFFSSYYPFPRNVRMAGTQDKPVALGELRYGSMSEAKEKFQGAVQLFTKNLSDNPDLGAVHGYFGHLSGEEWLAFHVKHMEHHLMQFGQLDFDAKIPELEKLIYKLNKSATAETPSKFGKMNAHQMIEHLGMVFLLSTGKFDFPYKGTEEDAQAYQEKFAESDNPFVDVFPQTSFGDPRPPRNEDIEDSKKELAKTFSRYLAYCDEHPEAVHPHYQLGNISVDQWRQVHVKHVQHHMRQFGMDV